MIAVLLTAPVAMQLGDITTPAASTFAITCGGTRTMKDSHALQGTQSTWKNTYYINLTTKKWLARFRDNPDPISRPIADISTDAITLENDPPPLDIVSRVTSLIFHPKTMQLSMEQSVGYRWGFVTTTITAICNYGESFPGSALFIATSKHMSWKVMQNVIDKTAVELAWPPPETGGTFYSFGTGVGHSFGISGDGVYLIALTGFSGRCQGDSSLPYLPPRGEIYDDKIYRVHAVQNGMPTKPHELESAVRAFREKAQEAGITLVAQSDDNSAASACAKK